MPASTSPNARQPSGAMPRLLVRRRMPCRSLWRGRCARGKACQPRFAGGAKRTAAQRQARRVAAVRTIGMAVNGHPWSVNHRSGETHEGGRVINNRKCHKPSNEDALTSNRRRVVCAVVNPELFSLSGGRRSRWHRRGGIAVRAAVPRRGAVRSMSNPTRCPTNQPSRQGKVNVWQQVRSAQAMLNGRQAGR